MSRVRTEREKCNIVTLRRNVMFKPEQVSMEIVSLILIFSITTKNNLRQKLGMRNKKEIKR